MQYYLIKDKNAVGKIDAHVPYLHDSQKGWVVDDDNILMDRIMGYDGEFIGRTAVLEQVKEISEQEALALIQ